MEKKIAGLGIWLCMTLTLWAQSRIKTVECYPLGKPFAEPVIELGTQDRLMVSFDDLSPEVNSYSYKIVHCDPDWNSSCLLYTSDAADD